MKLLITTLFITFLSSCSTKTCHSEEDMRVHWGSIRNYCRGVNVDSLISNSLSGQNNSKLSSPLHEECKEMVENQLENDKSLCYTNEELLY